MDSYRDPEGNVFWFDPNTQEWYKEHIWPDGEETLEPCHNPIPYMG